MELGVPAELIAGAQPLIVGLRRAPTVSSPMAAPRLLVVTERYWPEGSGGELATHLILELLRDSFEVTVVTGTRSPARVEGVRYIYEPLLSARNKHLLWFITLRLTRSRAFDKLVERADVVYVPGFAFPVIPLAKRLGKRVVVHLHGYIPASYTAVVLAPFEEHRHRILRDDLELECMRGFEHCAAAALSAWWMPGLARRWVSMADAVICVSRRQAQIISELAPELRDKITVIYNPPPKVPNIDKKPSEKPTFLYVGGGSYVKGYSTLIKALKMLASLGNNLNLKLILTNAYAERQINELIELKNRGLDIEIIGRVSYEKVLELHQHCWGLIHPTIFEETFSYAVVESMLMGTIPIASAVGAIPEIVEGSIAERYLVPPLRSAALVERILHVAGLGAEGATSLGKSLRLHIESKLDRRNIKRGLLEVLHGI